MRNVRLSRASTLLLLPMVVLIGTVGPSVTKARAETAPAFPYSANKVQHPLFLKWAKTMNDRIKHVDETKASVEWQANIPAYIPAKLKQVERPNAKEAKRIQKTSELYFDIFGKNRVDSLMWTGIESGNPLTRHEDYRWNSLMEQGLYDSNRRKKLVKELRALGIRNVRLGMSNHEIDADVDATWKETDALVKDLADGGIRISLDLHHFGIEDRFRVVDASGKTDGARSYYLNPAWPGYFAKFARKAIERYHRQISAITIMNEPETVVGFNGEMWHGGFPGWGTKDENRWYIERSIQVAKASVKARLEIEAFLGKIPQAQRPKLVYVHTEASVYKGYWEDFNLYRRFVISDMILGHEWLMENDPKSLLSIPVSELDGRWHRTEGSKRTNFDWVIENYVIFNQAPETRLALRNQLVKRLSELRNLHLELKKRFGKEMRSETAFAIDYYSHNEDRSPDLEVLNPEPQFYAYQVNEGNRGGIYNVIVDYFNRFKMPIMIGESGTPYNYFGAKWNQQILLECAKAAAGGIPFLGYTVYPAVDTYGWESALSVPREKAIFNPSGILTLDLEPRPFMKTVMDSLGEQMIKN